MYCSYQKSALCKSQCSHIHLTEHRPVPAPPAGGDLRQVGAALRGTVPAPGGTELPRHRHPPRHGPGGEVSLQPGA